MEELHRIHKDVPFGYWVEWLGPALRNLRRPGRDRRARDLGPGRQPEGPNARGQWV